MKQTLKRYRADHESTVVPCPACGHQMSGWTYEMGWKLYWINHTVNESGNKCWVEEADMKQAATLWEKKYELVEFIT